MSKFIRILCVFSILLFITLIVISCDEGQDPPSLLGQDSTSTDEQSTDAPSLSSTTADVYTSEVTTVTTTGPTEVTSSTPSSTTTSTTLPTGGNNMPTVEDTDTRFGAIHTVP